MDIRRIGAGIAALALAGTLAACGGTGAESTGGAGDGLPTSPGTFSTAFVDGDDSVKLTAKEAEEGTAASGTTINVEKGELLAISPDLEKGTVRVRLTATPAGGSDGQDSALATLEESVSGHVLNTYAVDPAEYTIGFSVADKEKVTGTVLVSTINAEEYQKQNAALDKAVSEADPATGGAASKAIGETIDKANEAVEEVAEKTAAADAAKDTDKG